MQLIAALSTKKPFCPTINPKSKQSAYQWKKKWKRIKKIRNLPDRHMCPSCGKAMNYMGLCGTCRETTGLTKHHWWSEHSQSGKT